MMQEPTYHPDDEILAAVAAGSADAGLSLAVETHAALCPTCAQALKQYAVIAGALFEAVPGEPVSDGCLDAVFAAIDASAPAAGVASEIAISLDPDLDKLPQPIRAIARDAAKHSGWRSHLPGIRTLDLADRDRAGDIDRETRLIRLEPGCGSPRHTHKGMEYTLVLTGAFSDDHGRYGVGDFVAASPDVVHRPIAEEGEACISLAVTTAPLQFTGALGLLQRVMGT